MQQVLPELANFQRDPSSGVRKFLADFLEAAATPRPPAGLKPDPAVLGAVLAVLHSLCADDTAAVAKAAIKGCSVLFKTALNAVLEGGRTSDYPEHVQHLWQQALQVDALSGPESYRQHDVSDCAHDSQMVSSLLHCVDESASLTLPVQSRPSAAKPYALVTGFGVRVQLQTSWFDDLCGEASRSWLCVAWH